MSRVLARAAHADTLVGLQQRPLGHSSLVSLLPRLADQLRFPSDIPAADRLSLAVGAVLFDLLLLELCHSLTICPTISIAAFSLVFDF
jgi:hypothetical protein